MKALHRPDKQRGIGRLPLARFIRNPLVSKECTTPGMSKADTQTNVHSSLTTQLKSYASRHFYFLNDSCLSIDEGRLVFGFYLDLARVLDHVIHTHHISQFLSPGITDPLHTCLSSFQVARVDAHLSVPSTESWWRDSR